MSVGVIFFLLIVGVVVAVLVYTAQQRAELRNSYERLASRYGGRCQPGGLFSTPSVQFIHDDAWVTIEISSTGGKHKTYYTHVRFRSPRLGIRCEVYPEGLWSRVGKLIGMVDVEIGSPDFDERYIISGSDPAALRSLLNPIVQSQIERLHRFLGNSDIYVAFGRNTLLVKKRSLISSRILLQQFVEMALELYDRAVQDLGEGIEFTQRTEPPKASEVMCQICGEPVTSQVVFCRRCKTPHHLDCWQYYGACSTYGCRETRYLLPKPRRRSGTPN
jgi:hypothetical protein